MEYGASALRRGLRLQAAIFVNIGKGRDGSLGPAIIGWKE